ncbi:MAG: selenium cofactor biosynthesis protein YqeC [Tissierellia bacterium]|nr:selenium cofactor biosynthesis protein YqeC [Tissierellia bacterium]
MKKSIDSILNMKEKDILGIVGCHGKTTMLYYLGREYKKRGKTLLTVSTKILIPENLKEDETLVFDLKDVPNTALVISAKEKKGKKMIGYHQDNFPKIDEFSYTIYEGDGSRGLPLKAWETWEPVILPGTTKTLGILPIYSLSMELSEDTVFQYPLFQKRYGNTMNIDVLKRIIIEENGIFQYAMGEKFFFLNGCDTKELLRYGKNIIEILKKECKDIHFFYGSGRKGIFYD